MTKGHDERERVGLYPLYLPTNFIRGEDKMQEVQSKSDSVLEPLTHVPGLVGEITDLIAADARCPCREVALGAAVTVVGTLTSRHTVGLAGNPTHLNVVIVGPATSGWLCDAVAKLIEAAGARVHRGDIESRIALDKLLTSAPPPAAIVVDDIIGFLTEAVRDRHLADTLCALWDSTSALPPCSLFGTARDSQFWPLLQDAGAAGDALFSRFLVFESNGGAVAQPHAQFPAHPEAREVYERRFDRTSGRQEYLERMPEQALRLATIRAAGIARGQFVEQLAGV
jgi:hypothetical protein